MKNKILPPKLIQDFLEYCADHPRKKEIQEYISLKNPQIAAKMKDLDPGLAKKYAIRISGVRGGCLGEVY